MAGLSICELTTYRWSFEEDVHHYASAGVGALGVWRQKLSDCGESHARQLLADHHLRVSSLFWAGGFTGACERRNQCKHHSDADMERRRRDEL